MCSKSSFLFITGVCCRVGICETLFMHSPVGGCLDCFQCLALMNKASINTCGFVCEHKFSFLLWRFLEMESLGHIVSLFLALKESAKCFSKVVVTFYTSTSNL